MRVQSNKLEYECRACPVGAICEKDRTCALRHSDMKCADGTNITGTWEVTDEATGIFKLKSCPSGYETRTESLMGSAELQMCHRCSSKWQYILDPAHHSCQECPPGLICHGDDSLHPVLPDSKWEKQDNIFKLLSCPTGYQVFSGEGSFSAEQQKCTPCGWGQECEISSCVRCNYCRPGFYKASPGTDPCQPCPPDSFRETEGASDLRMCNRCQAHSSTAGRVGQTSHTACRCDAAFYTVAAMGKHANQTLQCRPCPVGALCSGGKECALQDPSFRCSDGSNVTGDWHVAEDGHFVLASCPIGYEMRTIESGRGVRSEPDLQQCSPCPASTYIVRPQDMCRECPAGLICHGKDKVEIATANATWEIEDGIYKLRSCPPGTLLINSTLKEQKCMSCGPRTYSLDDEHGCTRGVCSERICLPCPQGADCLEDSTFVSKIEGTEWQDVYEGGTLMRRVAKCPTGHTLIRGSDAANDRCAVCKEGKYTVGATKYANTTCLSCPIGAECSGGRIESIKPGYWMLQLQVFDEYEMMNGAKCTIPGQVCAMLPAKTLDPTAKRRRKMECIDVPSFGLQCARNAAAQELHRRFGENYSGSAEILLCPHGACGANNMCLRNRDGPVCGFCKPGFAMTSTGCSVEMCPSHDELARFRFRAIMVASSITVVLLLALSWRPILVHVFCTESSDVGGAICCSMHSGVERICLLLHRKKFLQVVQLYFSYFQILESFCNFRLDWPPIVSNLLIWVRAAFHLDIVWMPLACLWNEISFLTRLGLYTVGSMLVIAILLVPVAAASLMNIPNKAPSTWNRVVDLFWINVMTFLFLFYSVLCVSTLQTFDCDSKLGLLKNDYRQVCPSLNSFEGIFAALFAVVYSIGIPTFYLLVLEKLHVRAIVHSKISNVRISAMLDVYWNEVKFEEIQRVASLVATQDDSDAKNFLDSCRTLFDELLQIQGTHTVLNIGILTEFSQRCKRPETAHLHILANCLQPLELAGKGQMDFDHFHSILSDAHLAVKFYANLFPGAKTSFLPPQNWLDQLTEAQLDALLFHDWQTELLQDETEDFFALQLQLDEFKSSKSRKFGLNENEFLEAAISKDTSGCMVTDHGSLMIDLQELELNGAAVWPVDWLSEYTLAENMFIKHLKGLKGFQRRISVQNMSRKAKMSTLLTIAKALVKSGKFFVPPQVWLPHASADSSNCKEHKLYSRMGFVLGPYRVQFWWWQAIEHLHKLLMIVLLRFIDPASPSPLISGCAITFGFLVLNEIVQPYCSDGLNGLQRMILLSQFLTLFLGIIVSIRDYIPGNQGSVVLALNTISFIALLLNATTLLWPIIQWPRFECMLTKCQAGYRKFLRFVLRHRKKQQQLASENCSRQHKQHRHADNAIVSSILCNVLQTTAAEPYSVAESKTCNMLPNNAQNLRSVALPCRTEIEVPTKTEACSHHLTFMPFDPMRAEAAYDQGLSDPFSRSGRVENAIEPDKDIKCSLKSLLPMSTALSFSSCNEICATGKSIGKVQTWLDSCNDDIEKTWFRPLSPRFDMHLECTGIKPASTGRLHHFT